MYAKTLRSIALGMIFMGGMYANAAKTGLDLLHNCTALVKALDGQSLSIEESTKIYQCSEYLIGYLDALWAARHAYNLENPKICWPEGVSVEQHARILKNWLERHPDKLHMPAAVLSFAALRESFPCE